MIAALALVAFVALQRGVELFYARRNTSRLLAAGGVEAGAEHYPLFILLHASWLIALLAYLPRSVEPNGWLVAVFSRFKACAFGRFGAWGRSGRRGSSRFPAPRWCAAVHTVSSAIPITWWSPARLRCFRSRSGNRGSHWASLF